MGRAWRQRFGEDGLGRVGEDPRGSGPQALDPRGDGRRDRAVDHHDDSAGCHALVVSHDGQAGRCQPGYGAKDLVGSWGLTSHTWSTPFKLCNDPRFEEKLIDMVGLYLNRPDKAVVLWMDEKSQFGVRPHRTEVPMMKGPAPTMTHDYKRNGTTTLFAALDVLTGNVIGSASPGTATPIPRIPAQDRQGVPEAPQVHMILDNYDTHSRTPTSRPGSNGSSTSTCTKPRPRRPG